MYKGLLSIIAVCLVMITAKLYVPQVQAEEQLSSWDIEYIIEDCEVTGNVSNDYLYDGEISC
jgi:hypothetical protein